MSKITNDSYVAIVVILISLITLWQTRGLNQMSAIFPQIAGVVLLVLGVTYLLTSFRKTDSKKPFAAIETKKVISMFIGMSAYVFLIWPFGFLLTSFAFIAFFVWFLQGAEHFWRRRLLRAGVSSVIVSFGFYFLFKYIFLVPLPTGIVFG